jgi:hypothetical protein
VQSFLNRNISCFLLSFPQDVELLIVQVNRSGVVEQITQGQVLEDPLLSLVSQCNSG